MVRLKLEVSEKAGGEWAQREAKASVEVGGEDDVFTFLGVGVNFSFRRYPCHHPFWDSPASAKPIDVTLGDERSSPGAPRCFLLPFLSFFSLGLLGVLFMLMLGVCDLLIEVGRSIFRSHWFGLECS